MTADAASAADLLRRFHARWPGATARGLAAGRLADGRSSYDALVDLARIGERVVDLGCGDGFLLERLVAAGHAAASLAGVDASGDELAAARARPALRGVSLIEAGAAALPLADGAADLVLSHLAFTLMSDVEAVVAEIARVLAPGRRFAAIVGGGPRRDDAFEALLGCLGPALRAAGVTPVRLGDRRARSPDGLASLLARDFAPPALTPLELTLDGPPAAVWARLTPTYEMTDLDDAAIAALREAFLLAVAPLVRPDGTVPCAMSLTLVTATRG